MATERQKRAIKKIVENGGNVSKGMRNAGYSPKSAKNPKHLTSSKGWAELMEQYLPDKDLARVHKEGLRAIRQENRLVDRDEEGRPIYEMVDIDDHPTRHKFLDTAYKLKGSYSPERKQVEVTDLSKYDDATLAKLAGMEGSSNGGAGEEDTGA